MPLTAPLKLDTVNNLLVSVPVVSCDKIKAGNSWVRVRVFRLKMETNRVKDIPTNQPLTMRICFMIPLPSTPIYEKWKEKQAITENWDDYGFHKEKPVYTHPTLSHETIKKYYKKSYREFYLRPSFIIRRVFRSLKTGQIFDDIRLVLATNWFS